MAFARKSAKPRTCLNEDGLYEYAVKALGRRMRTQAELRRLIESRAEPGESGSAMVTAAIQKLRERGYLDDAAYAETYTRLRQQNEKFGAGRVRADLRRKGVRDAVAERAVEEHYSQIDEETLARQHLERKRIAKPASEKDAARVVRRLVAAGFSIATVYKILRQWDCSLPEGALDGIESMEEKPFGE